MSRCFITLLFVVSAGCGDSFVFHRIGGTTNYPSTRTDAIRVDITKRSQLQKHGAELLGTIERTDAITVPHIVANKGGTHYIIVSGIIEVWRLNSDCGFPNRSKK